MAAVLESEPCADCGTEPTGLSLVAWSPAFGKHLCATCRARCSEAELHVTEQANQDAGLDICW